jgi:ABC-type spermidine/putrescine transport system permease subunit I
MNTKIAVHCGMFYCYLPFMILPLYSTFERLDLKLLEASSDLGATDLQTFFKITLPLTFSGIQTGALLVFIPSFGDFVVPALLGGDKDLYIGSVITHYFLTVRNVSMGSAFTCFATALLVLLLLFIFVVHRLISKENNNA